MTRPKIKRIFSVKYDDYHDINFGEKEENIDDYEFLKSFDKDKYFLFRNKVDNDYIMAQGKPHSNMYLSVEDIDEITMKMTYITVED